MSIGLRIDKKTMPDTNPFLSKDEFTTQVPPKQVVPGILEGAQILFREAVDLRRSFRGSLGRLTGLTPEDEEEKSMPPPDLSGCITETRKVLNALKALQDSISQVL